MSHELPNRAALREGRVSLDVVVAVWNEEEMLPLLFERLAAVFTPESLARSGIASVRYVMVDDGSRDRSAAVIAEAIAAGAPAVLYRLSRNFGHQSAISAGLHFADADVVAIIDADLQDPPELIPQMIERWRGGHDVIYAQRRKRREGPLKRLGYWAFYRAVAFLADIEIPLDTGDFCLMDRRVLDTLRALPEKLRFPRILRAWVGFRQEGIEYDRPPRQAGRTKYSLGRLYRLATDGIASASVRPLQAAQVFSVSYLLLILVLGILVLLRPGAIEAPPAVVAGFLLILVGNLVQVFCIYILGAYVGRTYLEVKGRPAFVVMEVVGDGEEMSEVELLSPVQEVDFPSEWYPLTAGDHFWFQWRLRAALAQIRAVGLRAEAPLRALEVGGGNGVLRAQLEASTRWSIDLNDLNLPALESAVPGRGRRLYYDVREERKDLVEAYDVVILFDVLEHIDASREFLRAVLRHVRPGGHVLLNVPALPSLYSAYDVAAGHVRRYDKRTLSEELSGTAVEIVDLRYWGLSLIPLLALRKALVSRQQSPGEIIRRGFRPPGPLAHAVLRMLMRVETPLLPAPPRGTSLLLAGRKP